jgi:hypothetical protein
MSRLPRSDPERASPIVCSLDIGGVRTQEQRWTALIGAAGIDVAATADGVRLRFRAEPQVEGELLELVAVENSCCAWARWEVRTEGNGGLVMHARTSGEGVTVLQSMFPPGS